MKKKIYNDVRRWSEIVLKTDNYIVVRWDADPWELEQIPKED